MSDETHLLSATHEECLNAYFREINRYPLLTQDEEIALAKRVKQGDEGALKKLIQANLRFVVSVAKKYVNHGLTLSDLINEGNLGLMKAGRRFDEERGFRFISYAVWWIRQSITQALKDKARTVRLPSSQISLLTKIKRARAELQNEGVFNPDPEQISERSEQPVEEVRRILQMDQVVLGLDDTDVERDQLPLVETLVAEDQARPDENLLRDSLRISIQRSLAALTDREAEIISRYYGLECEEAQTLQEIGESMGLTRERIRQIKNLALEKLRGIVVEDLFYESES